MNTIPELVSSAQAVVEGYADPIDTYIRIRSAISELEEALESIKSEAVNERAKYGKERLVRHGFEVELVSGRKLWSYKHGTAWAAAEAKKKHVEKLMQTARAQGSPIADAETGEVYEPAELSYASDTLRLSVAKEGK